MITFSIIRNQEKQNIKLLYRCSDHAFDVEPVRFNKGISVVVNDIELFLDDDCRVISVSGYCPERAWKPTRLSPPPYSDGGLKVFGLDMESIPKGMAFRVNDLIHYLPVYYNSEGWVCVGNPEDCGDQAAAFLPNCVAVVRGDQLIALWLKPTFEYSQEELIQDYCNKLITTLETGVPWKPKPGWISKLFEKFINFTRNHLP